MLTAKLLIANLAWRPMVPRQTARPMQLAASPAQATARYVPYKLMTPPNAQAATPTKVWPNKDTF